MFFRVWGGCSPNPSLQGIIGWKQTVRSMTNQCSGSKWEEGNNISCFDTMFHGAIWSTVCMCVTGGGGWWWLQWGLGVWFDLVTASELADHQKPSISAGIKHVSVTAIIHRVTGGTWARPWTRRKLMYTYLHIQQAWIQICLQDMKVTLSSQLDYDYNKSS